MIIGILKEIIKQEYRVSMTPSGAESLVQLGHKVLVEKGAGIGSNFEDIEYQNVGATIINLAFEIYKKADMVMHVKEPQPSEYDLIREGQIVFTYLSLVSDEKQTRALIKAKSINIAYETVELIDHSLPLLIPMSEIAGRLAVQEGAKYLEKHYGGSGVLLGGITGVKPGTVIIIGGGNAGTTAAYSAAGMGAQVYILDKNLQRLKFLSTIVPANVSTIAFNKHLLQQLLKDADLVIASLLNLGAKVDKVINRNDLKLMKKGSVLVDIAIDQGGCFETSKPTTHENPIFIVDGIIHYCVPNMPGAVPRTSTIALTNATLPYVIEIANKGWKQAALDNQALAKGINVIDGKITNQKVATNFGTYYPINDILLNKMETK